MSNERFWGENARPFFIQAAVGAVVLVVMLKVVMPAGLGDIIRDSIGMAFRAMGL